MFFIAMQAIRNTNDNREILLYKEEFSITIMQQIFMSAKPMLKIYKLGMNLYAV